MRMNVTVEEGVELLLSHAPAPAEEWVPSERSAGRTLSRDVVARENMPPFARSPYDGYALRAADAEQASRDAPVTLKILEELPAGCASTYEVGAGQAVKILTGAPVPSGADVIVPFEDTEYTSQTVTLFQPYPRGKNIVPAGEDVALGTVVAKAGDMISPALTGLLVGLGYTQTAVWRKVRVALISTGSELVNPGEPLTPGKIRNSSAYALRGYLEQAGASVTLLPIVGDDEEEIARSIRRGAEQADLVITTGGVSVGDYDLVGKSVERMGAEVLFWKVRMKPGSAFLASLWQGKPIVSLSGNPAAAVVAFFLLGLPLLRHMGGRGDCRLQSIQVRLEQDFPKASPNRRLIPGKLVIVDGLAYLRLAERQGNGMLSHLHGCDALGELPPGSPPMKAGSEIHAYRIG